MGEYIKWVEKVGNCEYTRWVYKYLGTISWCVIKLMSHCKEIIGWCIYLFCKSNTFLSNPCEAAIAKHKTNV
jgi:hypothetical protein